MTAGDVYAGSQQSGQALNLLSQNRMQLPVEFGIKIVGQKNVFFEKQSGEVAENKGSALKNKPEQS
ncbi:MAG TPA: hypothetical protein VFQ24_11240 [Terriglobia bacterium]|nr:hypothetical protein [Terriglobia bacterium]